MKRFIKQGLYRVGPGGAGEPGLMGHPASTVNRAHVPCVSGSQKDIFPPTTPPGRQDHITDDGYLPRAWSPGAA